MVKYKIGGKEYNDRSIYSKAKNMNASISGTQQAVEYLKRKGYKVRFWKETTKRWVLA